MRAKSYRIHGTLKDCFEAKPRRQSDYNRFVSMNMQMPPVFLTRQEVETGVTIAANYYISQGSLPSIGVTGTDETAYTDIRLGDLTIDETTTIAQFARTVVENNPEYRYYDQISYFSALQLTTPDGIPYVRGTQARVNLNPTDTTPLLSIAPSYGFSTTDGFLGHGEYVGQGAFGWVHSRRSSNRVLVSSQQLIANNAHAARRHRHCTRRKLLRQTDSQRSGNHLIQQRDTRPQRIKRPTSVHKAPTISTQSARPRMEGVSIHPPPCKKNPAPTADNCDRGGILYIRRSDTPSIGRPTAYYLFRISIVSEAISNSSSVGITTTFTFESAVEMTASSP